MKRLLFGIALILFGMAFCILSEIVEIYLLRSGLAKLAYILLPIVGLGVCISGLFEEDK